MPRVSRTARPEHRIDLDRSRKEPLHVQITAQLRTIIESGLLQPGSLLENEIDLSAQLGVSRPTLQKAIAELVTAGFLTRKPGRGTVVLPRTFPRRIDIGSLYDDLSGAGRNPATTVLTFEPAPAPEALEARLNAPVGPLTKIERVRFANGEPLAILRNWIPSHLVHFTREDLERQGLYALLREYDVATHLVEQRIGCRRSTPEEITHLNQLEDGDPNDPVLTVQRIGFDEAANFIEFGEHSYRAGRYFFETVVVG
ncbi:GntR family transcriptional regulator [Humidisolicoccus flavus]|uniref:GntR family transcriptional regulator n=1 Tax=Humidisolicoccus flavus TaxID=3111414 RepID=UPI00324EC207